jgi:hypothetical protein
MKSKSRQLWFLACKTARKCHEGSVVSDRWMNDRRQDSTLLSADCETAILFYTLVSLTRWRASSGG